MAPSVNTTINYTTQTSINEIIQKSDTTCLAECNANISDVNIIISDYSTVGNIKIQQQCVSDSLCSIKTQLDSIATQQLEAVQLGQAQANGQSLLTWPGISINTVTNMTNQYLENTITQTIDTVCKSVVNTDIRNINILVDNNSNVAGIEILQEGEATADCAIENSAKASVSQSASAEQTAKAISGSVLVLIFSMLTIVLIVLGMLYLKNKNEQIKIEANKDIVLKVIESGNQELIKKYIG